MPKTLNPIKHLRRLKRSLAKRALFRRFGQRWENPEAGFAKRSYATYDDYIAHQQAKLALHQFGDYDEKFRVALRERLTASAIDWRGRNVLCLAARIGTEVKAFLDLGAFAIGIDLNPGKGNRYVLHGDFHELQFADRSVDVVFTNSLDHAFDIDRIAKEIARVLKPNGVLIVEALRGRREGAQPGFFESFWWESIDELAAAFAKSGFVFEQRTPISYPWEGEALRFSQARLVS